MCEPLDRQVLLLLLGGYPGTEWLEGVVGICLAFKKAAILALSISPAVGSSSAGLAPALRKDSAVPVAHKCTAG